VRGNPADPQLPQRPPDLRQGRFPGFILRLPDRLIHHKHTLLLRVKLPRSPLALQRLGHAPETWSILAASSNAHKTWRRGQPPGGWAHRSPPTLSTSMIARSAEFGCFKLCGLEEKEPQREALPRTTLRTPYQ